MWSQLSTTCSNTTAVAQWGDPSCSRPQPAMNSGVRDGRSIVWLLPPTLHRVVSLELHVLHGVNSGYNSQDLLQQPVRKHASLLMPGQRTACTATHGMLSNSFRCVSAAEHHTAEQYSKTDRRKPRKNQRITQEEIYHGILARTSSRFQTFKKLLWKKSEVASQKSSWNKISLPIYQGHQTFSEQFCK